MELARYLMFHGRWFALMLTRRWTAPTRHVCRREKEQRRRTGKFYPTVRSAAAWSERLTSSERDKPEEDASCCDPDKGRTEQQDRRTGASRTRPKPSKNLRPRIVIACLDARVQTLGHEGGSFTAVA